MFKENKYTKTYYNIIKKSKERDTYGYFEKHHIIPKSLGGDNSENNIVTLTAREHFICHRLLTKMTTNKSDYHKMACAFHYICYGNSKQDKKFTSKQYETAKKIMSESKKGRRNNKEAYRNTYEKGFLKKWNGSVEQKKYLSELYKGRNITWGDKISATKKKNPFPNGNPMYSEENRDKVRNSKIGLKRLVKGNSIKMALPYSDKWNTLIADGYIPKMIG